VIKKPLIIPFLITLIFSTFSPIHSANAATVGSAPCIATVSSETGVSSTTSGNYCYVSFTSKAAATTWTVPAGVTSVDLLLIAGGGGGGGGAWGGGGGAGEVLSYVNYPVASGSSMNISVGSGGDGGIASLTFTGSPGNRASSGNNSSVAAVIAKGGGAGASYSWTSSPVTLAKGSDGGSGGGGTEQTTQQSGGSSTKSATSGSITAFGNIGGKGSAGAGSRAGGGGGGAGVAGSDGQTSVGGAGGNGTNTFSTWITAITSAMSGVTGWSTATTSGFIAGGGAGAAARATPSTGGSGGGGNSGISTSGAALSGKSGITNTGSGGGGASYNNASGAGGAGGAGLVVIRYLQPIIITIATITNKLSSRGSTSASATVSSGSLAYLASGACSVNSSTGAVTFTSTGNCTITARAASSPNPSASTTFEIVPNLTQRIISRSGVQPNSLSSFIPPPYLTTARSENAYACLDIVGVSGPTVLTSTNLNISLNSISGAEMTSLSSGKSYTINGTLAQVQAALATLKINSTSGRIMGANSGSIYLRVRANLIADAITDTQCLDIGNDGRITLYQFTSDQTRRKNIPQKSGSTP